MKITFFRNLILFGAFLCFGLTQAQEVSGTVSDAMGSLPGASVLVKGTTNGTQTDFDGNYTLDDVPEDGTLVFSYIGYATQEIPVNEQTTIDVTLEEDAQALDEVVIIGYGQTTIKDATGAVDVVNSEDFNKGVIASPEELLQGKTAGVQITQASGEPGAGINIRIRGTSSVRSNTNPLFVVDGVPLSGGDAARTQGGIGSAAPANPLNFLNPNDIESISVLKDASATAIYGSRGANGVVIVTTKSGKANQGGQFEFSSTLSIASPANEYDLLEPETFLASIDRYGGNSSVNDFGSDTDWQDVVTRTVASQNQNLSYSQSYDSGFVRTSFSYGKQFGVIENSALERITGRVNWTQRLFDDKLSLNIQTTLSRVNRDGTAISDNAGFQGDLLGAAYKANPTWPNDPSFLPPGGSNLNPAQLISYVLNETHTNRALLNFSAEYDFTDELSAKVNVGYDTSKAKTDIVFSSLIDNFNDGTSGNGRGRFGDREYNNRLLEATINYEKDFGNSKLTLLGGYSFQDFQTIGRDASAIGFATTDLNQMVKDLRNSTEAIENVIPSDFQNYGFDADGLFYTQLFPQPSVTEVAGPAGVNVNAVGVNTFDNTTELQSFFARANYTIAEKYILTATIRADGSSNFGGNNQYGYFPSGAFAWQLGDEDFIPETFSTLKLRLGYGITGNQEGLGYGNFITRERYGGVGPDQGGNINPPGLEQVAFANPNLKWEETSQANIGLDFGFANDRLNGSIDVYYKDTKDFLLQREAAQPSPQPFFFSNVDANIINQGIEIGLNYDIIQREEASWSLGINGSYNENEVKNFGGLIPFGQIFGQGLTGAFSQLLAEGQPLYSFYLREFIGFDENGQQQYAEGDVQQFVDKSALPNFNIGLSTSASYKNWDFSAALAGQYGHYIYNNTANAFFTAGAIANAQNVTRNVINTDEAGNNAPDVSTRFLESGDFLRLQNATLGYNWNLSGEGLFNTIRLYVTGQNLFVITDYSGIDPEINTSNTLNNLPSFGIEYTSFPRPRTYTFGLNATF
jgi:iron complex outermembrane receptor protein